MEAETTTQQGTPTEVDVPASLRRFSGLVDVRKIQNARVMIVGCGAVGRQTALQLASMGVKNFTLVDMDKVSNENVGSQGWPPYMVGSSKVDALSATIAVQHVYDVSDTEKLDAFLEEHIVKHDCEYGRKHLIAADPTHVFVCVDNMDVRKQVIEDIEECNEMTETSVQATFEARMGALACNVQTITKEADYRRWAKEWYSQEEAEKADTTTCTTKATIFCASMAGAMMCKTFMAVLNELPVPHSVSTDMALNAMWVNEQEEEPNNDD